MSKEKIFAQGIGFKKPREGAPSFVKGSVWINSAELVAFLKLHTKADGYVNLDLLQSQKGALYLALNDFVKGQDKPADNSDLDAEHTKFTSNSVKYPEDNINPDDIPF